MGVKSEVVRWYHKGWVRALFFVFVGLFIGATAVGITMKQLYGAAKNKVFPNPS